MAANLKELVGRYKADRESVYNTWFIESEARMKAFRSIRRGVGIELGPSCWQCARQGGFL